MFVRMPGSPMWLIRIAALDRLVSQSGLRSEMRAALVQENQGNT